MDRGAWHATVHGVAKSRTRLNRLSMHACTYAKCKAGLDPDLVVFILQKSRVFSGQLRAVV